MLKCEPVPQDYRLVFDLAFSHSFCLRDVAWIRPAYVLTKHGDVGTTSPTVRVRQGPPQTNPNVGSHHYHTIPLIILNYRKTVLGVTSREGAPRTRKTATMGTPGGWNFVVVRTDWLARGTWWYRPLEVE